MKQVIYCLKFEGQSAPVGPGRSRALGSAPSSTMTSFVTAEGVSGDFQQVPGGTAGFEAEVTPVGKSTFIESGKVYFGNQQSGFSFSTDGEGYVGPSADRRYAEQGANWWRVDQGFGAFAGATGLVTVNFLKTFPNAAGISDLVVFQFGLLVLP